MYLSAEIPVGSFLQTKEGVRLEMNRTKLFYIPLPLESGTQSVISTVSVLLSCLRRSAYTEP
jgi:hypothetical protein